MPYGSTVLSGTPPTRTQRIWTMPAARAPLDMTHSALSTTKTLSTTTETIWLASTYRWLGHVPSQHYVFACLFVGDAHPLFWGHYAWGSPVVCVIVDVLSENAEYVAASTRPRFTDVKPEVATWWGERSKPEYVERGIPTHQLSSKREGIGGKFRF